MTPTNTTPERPTGQPNRRAHHPGTGWFIGDDTNGDTSRRVCHRWEVAA